MRMTQVLPKMNQCNLLQTYHDFSKNPIHLGILLTSQPIRLSILRGVQGKKGFYSRSKLSSSCPVTRALRCSTSNGNRNVHGRQRCIIAFGFLQQNDSAHSWGLGYTAMPSSTNKATTGWLLDPAVETEHVTMELPKTVLCEMAIMN